MDNLNRAIIIISRIAGVFMWVGTALSVVLAGLGIFGRFDTMRCFASVTPQTAELTEGSFSLLAQDAAGRPPRGACVIFFITLAIRHMH